MPASRRAVLFGAVLFGAGAGVLVSVVGTGALAQGSPGPSGAAPSAAAPSGAGANGGSTGGGSTGGARTGPVRLVALGDSLTAGYLLPAPAAFPAQLERALRARGRNVEIANAGVSGDTVRGGLDRLDWSVPDGTDGVIVELGANDMLRGLPPAQTRADLEAILKSLKARNIPVLLAGMYASRNLGEAYVKAFETMYPELAAAYGAELYPFFLDGIAGERTLLLPDGLHPTADGVARIVERILPTVERFLDRIAARTG